MPTNSYSSPDYWSKKAFSEGYPARSVYKLKEIDEKFRLLRTKIRVLDVGAAPGSWTLYTLKRLQKTGKLVAVDLQPLAKNVIKNAEADNFIFFQGDVLDDRVRGKIESEGPYSLILSDAAPATTGARAVDASRSAEIAAAVLEYAKRTLAPGGNCAIKIFQGGEEAALLKTMREFFASARTFKPKASRAESFETYLIGANKKTVPAN